MLKRMLAAGGLLGALLLVGAPKADAGFSFGITVPGFTYYQSNVPPPVAYRSDPYYPAEYYAPAPTYGYGGYGGYGYGGYRYDDGWRYRRANRHWHRGCHRY